MPSEIIILIIVFLSGSGCSEQKTKNFSDFKENIFYFRGMKSWALIYSSQSHSWSSSAFWTLPLFSLPHMNCEKISRPYYQLRGRSFEAIPYFLYIRANHFKNKHSLAKITLEHNVLNCFSLKWWKKAGESEMKKNEIKERCEEQLKEGKAIVS